jgi:diguanylate cyclase (GGDEF)-like protein
MEAAYLATRHDPLVVALACALAVFASYVTLELARRVHVSEGVLRIGWWAGGALTMGTGVWAMHFVAMLGYDAGQWLGFEPTLTALSWLAAVAAGGVALAAAARPHIGTWQVLGGASAMAAAICGMHYVGMAALEMLPGIEWDRRYVLLSVVVAWGASAAALWIFGRLRPLRGAHRIRMQGAAALAMGIAIAGMHFVGMAAARIPSGSVCTSVDGLGGRGMLLLVSTAAFLVLTVALLLSLADAQRQRGERQMRRTLQATNAELLQVNAELQRLAFRDPLTGVSNRAHLLDRLQHACELLARDATDAAAAKLALLYIDLDGFKPVNDTFGHEAGDRLLVEIAQRLQGLVRDSDTVARIGGDEFVLLLESDDALASGVACAERVLRALHRPFEIGIGQPVQLSASVGIAVHPDHGADGHLLARADMAMYAAKQRGGGAWAVYDSQMSDGASQQVMLQQALRGAIERGELQLHYQPKIAAGDGGVHGAEALLRWCHPQRGWISPAVFVPVAERFGLIGAIGRWVLDEACAQLARWREQGVHCRVAVNLSAVQLRQPDLVEQVAQALERHGIEPASLVLEITETAVMDDLQQQAQHLQRLAALGVRLSIDDFGTGYSSLAYLRRLPVRQLKLDRSLLADIETAPASRAIVDAVVRLAHALALEVVAEGVETEAQARLLRELGCDVLQGWHYARPMPAERLAAWLDARRRAPAEPAVQAVAELTV